MTWGEVVGLAVVQGLTEFLPVSSSGHLLAARLLFGVSDANGVALDAFLHLGTLGAVLVYYWRMWVRLGLSVWRQESPPVGADGGGNGERRLLGQLAVATVPGAVVGYALADAADAVRTPAVLAGALLFTGAVLWAAESLGRGQKTVAEMRWREAALVGLAQVVALLPGVSRSGMTIAAGRAQGLARREAATFSFLLSAPIIAGAGLHSVPALWGVAGLDWGQLLAGLAVSAASGLLAIHWFLRVIERVSLRPFAVYVAMLALVVWLYGG